MARTLRALSRLGPAVALVLGGLQILAPDAAGAATAVTIDGPTGCTGTTYCYTPPTVTVASGDTVTWTSQSPAPHTVTRCDPSVCNGTDGGTGTDPTFDQSAPNTGNSVSQTFTGAGTYNYYCKIHGFSVMHGTVTVQGQAAPTTTTTAGSPTTTGSPGTAAATSPSPATASPPAAPAASPAQAVAGQVNFTG
jgi:plastocyanin